MFASLLLDAIPILMIILIGIYYRKCAKSSQGVNRDWPAPRVGSRFDPTMRYGRAGGKWVQL